MNINDLPDNPLRGLTEVIVRDGRVSAGFDDSTLLGSILLRFAERNEVFELAASDPLAETSLPLFLDFKIQDLSETIESEVGPHEIPPNFVAHVNKYPDFAPAGLETMQLMILDRNRPCSIQVIDEVEIPNAHLGRCLSLGVACHRAIADVSVSFHDAEAKKDRTFVFDLDQKYAGGTTSDRFQEISIPLPKADGSCIKSVSLNFHDYVDDLSGSEPFLFVTNVRVHNQTVQEEVTTPHRLVRRPKGGAKQRWMTARVQGKWARGGALSICYDDGRQTEAFEVMKCPDWNISLKQSYGHTIIVESDEDCQIVLSIDGENALKALLTAGENTLRIPDKYLNGTTRSVALKDETGTFVLCERYDLLPDRVASEDSHGMTSVPVTRAAMDVHTPHRYQSLLMHLADSGEDSRLRQLANAIAVLENGHEGIRYEPISFPVVDNPAVSVVIPAHNNFPATYYALCSLLVAHNRTEFEIIVVDDASDDETNSIEDLVTGLIVIRNPRPERFIRACNKGAEAARGNYIVFLNNDVEVTNGWVDELVDAFDMFDGVGLVGSKLVFPSGLLQDAGGIVWGSGNPWNYGNGCNPMEPRFNYTRDADYLSGAAMMITKDIWQQVAGFSNYLEPMYFEDTDLAFKVRDLGFRTLYVPSSVVYHFGGMTSGTDVSTGFKRFQEVNRPKFKRRWIERFIHHGKEGQDPDLEKDRGIVGRVLFVDYTTPRPDRDAGGYAAIQEMKLVQSLGYKVSFLPTNLLYDGANTEALQRSGIEAVYAPYYLSPADFLENHADEFDAIYITRYYVVQEVLEQIRRVAPSTKVLFNNADLHFLREMRSAANSGDEAAMIRANEVRTKELDIVQKVDLVLSYNEMEHAILEAQTDGRAKVMKCPWVVRTCDEVQGFEERSGISFLGGFGHPPNLEGIIWFSRTVMPLLETNKEPPVLHIYGSKMGGDVRALASDLIRPIGFIDDASDAFHPHRVFVAPLLSGAGLKGKVLAAIAHGVPSVLSPTAAEATGLRSGSECFVADGPEDWVDAITKLHSDRELWAAISRNALTFARQSYSFEAGRDKMRHAFEAVDLFSPKA